MEPSTPFLRQEADLGSVSPSASSCRPCAAGLLRDRRRTQQQRCAQHAVKARGRTRLRRPATTPFPRLSRRRCCAQQLPPRSHHERVHVSCIAWRIRCAKAFASATQKSRRAAHPRSSKFLQGHPGGARAAANRHRIRLRRRSFALSREEILLSFPASKPSRSNGGPSALQSQGAARPRLMTEWAMAAPASTSTRRLHRLAFLHRSRHRSRRRRNLHDRQQREALPRRNPRRPELRQRRRRDVIKGGKRHPDVHDKSRSIPTPPSSEGKPSSVQTPPSEPTSSAAKRPCQLPRHLRGKAAQHPRQTRPPHSARS